MSTTTMMMMMMMMHGGEDNELTVVIKTDVVHFVVTGFRPFKLYFCDVTMKV